MDTNPYAAPRDLSPPPTATGDEAQRYEYLKHEASVRGVARVYLTGGVTSLLSAAVLAAIPTGASDPDYLWGLGFLGILALWTASGLQKLMLAGWFAASVLSSLALVLAVIELPARIVPLATGIAAVVTQGYILLILFSPKSNSVCSGRYRKIVAATPHLKCSTPLAMWILPGLTVFVILTTLRLSTARVNCGRRVF